MNNVQEIRPQENKTCPFLPGVGVPAEPVGLVKGVQQVNIQMITTPCMKAACAFWHVVEDAPAVGFCLVHRALEAYIFGKDEIA